MPVPTNYFDQFDDAPTQVVAPNGVRIQDAQAGIDEKHANAAGKIIDNGIKTATGPAIIGKTQTEAQIAQQNLVAAQNKNLAAAQTGMDAATKARSAQASTLMQTDAVLRAIHSAQSHTTDRSTGLMGQVGSYIPMDSNAYLLGQDLATIKPNIAFGNYENIKDNAPKGAQGGFRLTEPEIQMLANMQGSLSQGLPAHVLKDNLNNIEQEYRRRATAAAGLNPDDMAVQKEMGILPTKPDSVLGRAQGIGMFGNLRPADASSAYNNGLAVVRKLTAKDTPQVQALALQTYNNSPHVQTMRRVMTMPGSINSQTPPNGRRSQTGDRPADIDAILQQYGGN